MKAVQARHPALSREADVIMPSAGKLGDDAQHSKAQARL